MSVKKNLLSVIAVSSTGALAPGPLSFTAVASGAYVGALGGLMIATGHMAFELPFTMVLARGVGGALRDRRVKLALDAAFVASALYFSYLTFKSALDPSSNNAAGASTLLSALAAGFLLTGLNAYFIAWWLTVGLPVVKVFSEARSLAKLGYYFSHVSIDYAWLTLLSFLGFVISTQFYTLMLVGIGAALVAMAARHLYAAVLKPLLA